MECKKRWSCQLSLKSRQNESSITVLMRILVISSQYAWHNPQLSYAIKDRQQEAERHSRYLTLLSGYILQNIMSYIKWKLIFFSI